MAHDNRLRGKLLTNLDQQASTKETDIHSYLNVLSLSEVEKEKWRNWWGKNNTIYDLAKSANMESPYSIQYATLSWFIHSTPPGIDFYIFDEGETRRVDWKSNPPAATITAASEVFLASAAAYMLEIINVLAEVYEFDYSEELNEAAEALKNFNNN